MKREYWIKAIFDSKGKRVSYWKVFAKIFVPIMLVAIAVLIFVPDTPVVKLKKEPFTGVKQSIDYTCYVTSIYYKGDRKQNHMDFIDSPCWNDSIICFRYKEGLKVIAKYQRIDSIKCN